MTNTEEGTRDEGAQENIWTSESENYTRTKKHFDAELDKLYSSPNIRTIKSKRTGWTEHIVCMREIKVINNFIQNMCSIPLGRSRRK